MSGIVYLLDDRSYNIKDWLFELYVLRRYIVVSSWGSTQS